MYNDVGCLWKLAPIETALPQWARYSYMVYKGTHITALSSVVNFMPPRWFHSSKTICWILSLLLPSSLCVVYKTHTHTHTQTSVKLNCKKKKIHQKLLNVFGLNCKRYSRKNAEVVLVLPLSDVDRLLRKCLCWFLRWWVERKPDRTGSDAVPKCTCQLFLKICFYFS